MRKYLVYAAICLLGLSACRKEDQKKEKEQMEIQDGTLVRNSADHWSLIPNQYIITYQDSLSPAGSRTLRGIRDYTMSLLRKHNISSIKLLRTFNSGIQGFTAILNEGELAKLRMDPEVKNIEPDRIIHLNGSIVRPYSQSNQILPWGIKKTGFADGSGKTCWIIDTGIDFNHPDLNVDVARSKSFLPDESSASDMNGHGTHIAGIIGAKNNSFGVIGVASNATLVSLRALDANGSGNLSYIIDAISWVSANAKPGDVVNMSIGGDESYTLDNAVYRASLKGIYFSIAAGNDARSATLNSPARINSPYVFTVSAMDQNDTYASFSNYGNPPVDWCAPGVRILSTYYGGGYATLSGTSMAAPHVSGLLLLKGSNIHDAGPVKDDPDAQADRMAHL